MVLAYYHVVPGSGREIGKVWLGERLFRPVQVIQVSGVGSAVSVVPDRCIPGSAIGTYALVRRSSCLVRAVGVVWHRLVWHRCAPVQEIGARLLGSYLEVAQV